MGAISFDRQRSARTGGRTRAHRSRTAAMYFISNHLSYMDTPVVLRTCPVQFRFLAKRGLVSDTVAGTAPRPCRPYPRSARRSPRSSEDHAAGRAKPFSRKRSRCWFSRKGAALKMAKLRPFKEGGSLHRDSRGSSARSRRADRHATRCCRMVRAWFSRGGSLLRILQPIETPALDV